MLKPVIRIALTILMYCGVLLFLAPYVTGRVFTGVIFIVTGAAVAIIAGLARCFLTEGGCTEKEYQAQHLP